MLRLFFIFLLLFIVNLSASSLLHDQIEEDLNPIADHSFTGRELKGWFEELSKTKAVLYCKIRKNRIFWRKSIIRNVEPRNEVIFQFLAQLTKRAALPDLDFILCTEDGFHENSKYPVFTFAANKKSKKNVCLFPDMEALEGGEKYINDCKAYSSLFPWHQKVEKGFFRGCSTGRFDLAEKHFGNDRMRAMVFSYDYPELLESDFSAIFYMPIEDLMNQMGKPVQPSKSIKDHFAYKYLLDIDGNSCTYSRCRWILLSNSILLKVSSEFTQWYYKCLIPYENYIPVRNDLSDLQEVFSWLKQEDQTAYAIAMNGQKLGEEIFSSEAIENYVYKLLSDYSKKMVIESRSR